MRPKFPNDELIGKRFGKLTVLQYEMPTQAGIRGTYKCICDCGNITHSRKYALLRGKSMSCGYCNQKPIYPGMKTKMLTVIRENGRDKNRNILWECRCDCGKTVNVSANSLRRGQQSCGCMQGSVTHHQTNTRLYSIWAGIKRRCYNTHDKSYQKWYGSKGIKMCDEWKNDFMAFHDWAISNRYTEDLTIDRIDVSGNYEPSNCRWMTPQEQAANRSNNVRFAYNGETLTEAEWARRLGVNPKTIKRRFESCGSPYGREGESSA